MKRQQMAPSENEPCEERLKVCFRLLNASTFLNFKCGYDFSQRKIPQIFLTLEDHSLVLCTQCPFACCSDAITPNPRNPTSSHFLLCDRIHYMTIHFNSIPELALSGPYPPILVPCLDFAIIRIRAPSYSLFKSHLGHECGPATALRKAREWRLRPSWKDGQISIFIPSAHGYVRRIQV